ncbi:cation:proton antiporter [Sediminivirga luteola]|uniref:Peptidase n=1 Tax=Sediminivirga luteola TaxID=1774748 RepID=A0A8J2U0W5_9MICO|nr:sodium:proton antiporter [Sediminivirga luteola]MCI2264885.1 cation:proton antiporter [Sediminivirga luteola]GGA26556.1 peptidase [Sediminivirga luteola]
MEEYALLAVVAVLIIVATSLFAQKHGVAAPVLLVLVGIGCSFIPGTPEILVEPEWILAIVLPPILYAAAVNVPVTDFRRSIGTITALSVVLVVVSALAAGTLIWWLIPGLGLPAAIALGAVVSPPDAVAAISIGKRLGLPPRLITALEGEGLVNDATALVLLRTAVAAIAGSFSFWDALGDFGYALAVGIAVGALVGLVSVRVRSAIRQEPVLTTAISFVVPFLAFIPAEHLGASGVIAVVTAGLITGHQSARRFSAHDRIAERTNWRTIQTLLENGVFLLMGYEITAVVGDLRAEDRDIAAAVGIALATTGVLIVVRALFSAGLVLWLRSARRRAVGQLAFLDEFSDAVAAKGGGEGRFARVERVVRRRRADAEALAREGLGWRGGAVLAWSGMRGVVTLAAAQSLPHDVPHRAELVFIAFTVAVTTLLLHGGTLPWLIRRLGIRGSDEAHERQELSRLMQEMSTATQEFLAGPSLRREDGKPFDEEVLQEARSRAAAMGDAVAMLLDQTDRETAFHQRRELNRQLLEVEQDVLLDARAEGTYSSKTLERVQHFLDERGSRF